MRLIRLPLLAARALAEKPACIPTSRPRAVAKKAGIGYERDVAAALARLGCQHGRWFEYRDGGGIGYCQPDILLPWQGRVVVLECKYTWTPVARQQLDLLYRPVIEKVTDRETLGIVVCKRLLPDVRLSAICHSIEEALARSHRGDAVLHWIGQGALTAA